MKRRGFNFATAKHRAASRIEDMDDRRVSPRDKCETADCDGGRPGRAGSAAPKAAEAKPRRERGHTAAKPYMNKLKPEIVPLELMPNGTIKVTINGKTAYVAATVKAASGGMAATYRLAGNYYGLSDEEYSRIKADCPKIKQPTVAELELRKIKIMFAHAETLIDNQGEYFRTIQRAEKARAAWEAKYSVADRKMANKSAEAEHMRRKKAAKTADKPSATGSASKGRPKG